jgi:hypothetical protein
MPAPDFQTLLGFFKAMANESRLRMVGLLAERERSGQELAELLGLKEPTVSHHLAVLRSIGLIATRADGVTHWHALRGEALTELNRALFDKSAAGALTAPTVSWEDKVVSTFVTADGTLSQIPASRRKRRVVLAWLVEAFDPTKRIPEAEINEVLQRRHWDSATLRRELVGYRMMDRQAGVYWRRPKEEWLSE